MLILSHYQTEIILQARKEGKTNVTTSTDLGLHLSNIRLANNACLLPGDIALPWSVLEHINENENSCFIIEHGEAHPIRVESQISGRIYTLMPTEKAPTMLISGIPMHRIKDTNPYRDTLEKIRTLTPVRGKVLDTATGLGYTAIEAAKTAQLVITIEIDPAVIEIARHNPWSHALFNNPHIQQIIGDSFDEIEHFDPESFDCIVHDPPTIQLAGDLFSSAYYKQAYRILKRNGRMFHYIADPDSKIGQRLSGGITQRLHQAGFTRIIPKPKAFGIVAYK